MNTQRPTSDEAWFAGADPEAPEVTASEATPTRLRARDLARAGLVLAAVLLLVALLGWSIGLFDVGPDASANACERACSLAGFDGTTSADGDCVCVPQG